MAFAQNLLYSVGIQPEVTYGVAPVSPALVELPMSTFNVNRTQTALEGDNLNGTGEIDYVRMGNVAVAGDIGFKFDSITFDTVLEGVMHNTFSTGVLKRSGLTIKSYHAEGRVNDLTDYFLFTGLVFDRLELSVGADGFVEATAGVLARDQVPSGTSFDSALTANKQTSALVSYEATLSWKGATAKCVDASIQIENGMSPIPIIGDKLTAGMTKGRFRVSGSFQAYFEGIGYHQDFNSEVEDEMILTLDDGTTSYEFLMPRVKLTNVDMNPAGEGSLVLNAGYTALFDDTEATALKITKA
jgi:hypothetical protein